MSTRRTQKICSEAPSRSSKVTPRTRRGKSPRRLFTQPITVLRLGRLLCHSDGLYIKLKLFRGVGFLYTPEFRVIFTQKSKVILREDRTVTNPFGFRRVYFDRIDNCFAEALAWKPQSTVALNSYMGFFQLQAKYPFVEELLQNHDSMVWQSPNSRQVSVLNIRKTLEVITPYPDPLVIPWDLKKSDRSWGDLEAA